MQDYEKLGQFYLGRLYDLASKEAKEDLLLYDSRDLTTHAVVVGMTGSGKTGLSISLIEEAAIDGVPAILIDPKGDLSNLLLTFPQLREEDFLPWINGDEARMKGLTSEAYAAQQAQLWRDGLAKWGQSGERIQRLRDAADFCIYTPASSAGVPVSIVKSFAAPAQDVLEDRELLRERISTTVISLLGLIGVEADPMQSREYILLATILETVWRSGQDLDLAKLIQQVQTPPINRVGVLDLESFYPAKERFALVMALNNLLASPGFSAWLEGEALDIGQMLYGPQGKPRIAIFSIAHLNDAERMFFVSLLLNQVVGWMRAQQGTTSLRAIVYMDEIFGYLPPTANPPSKLPMLTLLKQARAFGIGLVLATQNPVDLDYKALANAGTWFIGRLQTERDKARVLDGLEGAAVAAGSQFNRQNMDTLLSGLGNRVFLLNNTHEDAPVVMQTRWDLSYLRGPLTRDQIRTLMSPYKAAASRASAPVPSPLQAPVKTAPDAAANTAHAPIPLSGAPALPPDVPVYFLPLRTGPQGTCPPGCHLTYRPGILGAARVTFSDIRTRLSEAQAKMFVCPLSNGPIAVDWSGASEVGLTPADLQNGPQAAASFADLPLAVRAKNLVTWGRDLAGWIYSSQSLGLMRSPGLGILSQTGESERDFRVRLAQMAREKRDEGIEILRKKYAPKLATLQDRQRRADQAVERQREQVRQQQMNVALSIGSTLLGAFTGRRVGSRASSAVRAVGRSSNERSDVERAQENAAVIQKQMEDLQAAFNQEVAATNARMDPLSEPLERIEIRPKKTDIAVQLTAVAWMPYWQDEEGTLKPAW
jgi:hypothetical protein